MNNHTDMPEADKGFVGEVFQSNKYGEFKVLRRSGTRSPESSVAVYEIRFTKTGYVTENEKDNILNGRVRDPYFPIYNGVGFIGDTTTRPSGVRRDKKSYSRWKKMLARCYNPDHSAYSDYGGRGIKVCQRWHCFANYEKDLPNLPNYGEPDHNTVDRINNDGDYEPENCRWADWETQSKNKRKSSQRKWFVAISPEGKVYESDHQERFSKKHVLQNSGICACLKGYQGTHKGWVFRYKDDHLNNEFSRKTKKVSGDFVGFSPDGTIFKGSNQSRFAQKHGLRGSLISKCLNGRQKTHKGWTFSWVSELEKEEIV